MCGIVGYTGKNQVTPILMDGLAKLEYRGYDSAGICVRSSGGRLNVVKAKGKLKNLDALISGNRFEGTCGIGHTRWATHGEPSEINAHPHHNGDLTIVAVHNGIIENYLELKDKLASKGYTFYSQTDTEIATKLVDYYYKKWGNPIEAMVSFTLRVRGSYALAVMFADRPEEIYVARKDSPLIVGITEEGTHLASDVPAILKFTRDVYYMDNLQVGCLTKGGATFYDVDRRQVDLKPVHIDWDVSSAERGGYNHFMMKEIHEQPEVIKSVLGSFIKNGGIDLSEAGITDAVLKGVNKIHVAACGSAYHVGVVAKYVTEKLARVSVDVDIASEFRYRNPLLSKDDLVIIISQSGETADSLAALREAKSRGVKTLAIVNVVGSSIAREADAVLYTKAGPEISVATTKAYSSQLIVCYLLAIKLASVRGEIDGERYKALIAELNSLPKKIASLISKDEDIKRFATEIISKRDVFFIGRGIDYAVSLEGSLKLKEISYIHSEAYAAGELKHGTISLIEEGTLVVGIITQPELAEKTLSNLIETKSRGSFTMTVICEDNPDAESHSDFTVKIPVTDELFTASLSVIPLQLLSYYVSVARGFDVDKPRNLAKCVAVE